MRPLTLVGLRATLFLSFGRTALAIVPITPFAETFFPCRILLAVLVTWVNVRLAFVNLPGLPLNLDFFTAFMPADTALLKEDAFLLTVWGVIA